MIRICASILIDIVLQMSKSGQQFFYAVKRGKIPGIYFSWPECEKQIKGFANPVFKKFSTCEECLQFVNGNSASKTPSYASNHKDDEPKIKIFNSSFENVSSVDSSPESLVHSVHLLKQNMKLAMENIDTLKTELIEVKTTLSRLERTFFSGLGSKRHFSTGDSSQETPKKLSRIESAQCFTGSQFNEDEGVEVYTDGGCFLNGQSGARAGVGVYWSPSDPDNVSEPLQGKPTNNRAEIYAAVRAIQIAKRKGVKNLILHTDSQFLINGITKWIKNWKRNQWTKATGSPVINKDDFETLDQELQGINVKWVYVRGHNGNIGNEEADRLAKCGAEKSS